MTSHLAKRYFQFCTAGGLGVAVDMTVFAALSSPLMLGLDVTLGKVVAAEVAMLNNFWWNNHWTFRAPETAGHASNWPWNRFVRFNLACASGLVLGVALLNIMFRVLHLNPYLANGVAIVAASAWNYFVCARLVWPDRQPV